MVTQYFDSLRVHDGYIWAVDDIEGTEAPLDVSSVCWSEPTYERTIIEIKQRTGSSWFSRRKFESALAAKNYVDANMPF